MKFYKYFLILIIFILFFNLLPVLAQNQETGFKGFSLMNWVSDPCRENGDCGLDDVLSLAVGISRIIFALSGIVALVLFIYGGITWLTSAGNPEKVKRGKNIFIATVMGLFIIFLAYAIINTILDYFVCDNEIRKLLLEQGWNLSQKGCRIQ